MVDLLRSEEVHGQGNGQLNSRISLSAVYIVYNTSMSSEEDIYLDSNDGSGDVEAGDDDNDFAETQENEEEGTPAVKYRLAKESIGFDDNHAIELLYDVYNDQNAPDILKGKAIRRAGLVLSQHDDIEAIVQVVELIIACFEADMISEGKCEDTIREMLGNVMRSEEFLRQFLDVATEKANKSTQISLYLDLRLRQCELMMKYAEYESARTYISEVEKFCPIPPDPNDFAMCRYAVRLLILRIELADLEGDETEVFKNYELAVRIGHNCLMPVQEAMLKHIEGYRLFKEKDVKSARAKFFEAFRDFNEAGSDKRVKSLAYCALAAMAAHEDVNLFMAPEVKEFACHPVVAPLAQLMHAYHQADIIEFSDRLESAEKVFNSEFCSSLLREVRKFVLSKAVKIFCQKYAHVDMSYVAQSLQSSNEEIKEVVFELILSGELNGLVDSSTMEITLKKPRKPSVYLQGTSQLLQSLRLIVEDIVKMTKPKGPDA